MFHTTSHIHMPRNRRPSALRTFVTSSSFGPAVKEPFRQGVLFTSIAGVLLLIGCILTWLGFNDVFRGTISMTGPLLIVLSLLLLLFSMRQFLMACKQNNTRDSRVQVPIEHGTVTTMVINRNDGAGAVTVIMDTLDVEPDRTWGNYAEEYAPPSYSEVTQRSGSTSSSMQRQASPSEFDYEPPPTYDDAISGPTFEESIQDRSNEVSQEQDEQHPSEEPPPHVFTVTG